MKLKLIAGCALLGTSMLGCSDESGPTGPGKIRYDNPFKGTWQYVKFVEFANGGEDTLDLTDTFKGITVVFYDSTGRHNVPSRPNSPRDSLRYYFTADSLYETGFIDNFLNYKGRPYVFKGPEKDTLDFSDPDHIEMLIRAK